MKKLKIKKLMDFSKTLKILLVEDDEDTREQIYKLLGNFFENIVLANNGIDGYNKYKKYSDEINLIITDIEMPELDGIEMCIKIKELDEDMPIIIISGENKIKYFTQSIKLGVDGFLLKPLNINQFIGILSKIITNIQNNKKVKKELENRKRLEKQKILKNMLDNIAHQWRQPLSVISTVAGTIELANEHGLATKEKNIKNSQKIIKATELLTKMIEDFRHFFDDTYATKKEEINFKEIVDKTVNKFDSIETIFNIKEIELQENKKLIEDIISPVCNNAYEAINNLTTKKLIFIDIYKSKNYIHIVIKDNGGGVDSKIMDKIFEPYVTTKHNYFGVGLNLYFVNYIVVEYFGGLIEVTNESYTYDDKEYCGAKFDIKIKPMDFKFNKE